MLVGQGKKSQKYFDLSTFNYNLYDSNPCSSLGVMNFQKWELFSGSPGIGYIACEAISMLEYVKNTKNVKILTNSKQFLSTAIKLTRI